MRQVLVEGLNLYMNPLTTHSHLSAPRLRAGMGTSESSRASRGFRLRPANIYPATGLTSLGGLVKAAPGCRTAEGLSQTGLKGQAIAMAAPPCQHNKALLGGLLPWWQPQPPWRWLCIRPCQGRRTKATCMKVLTQTVNRTVLRCLRGLVVTKQTFLHVRETL